MSCTNPQTTRITNCAGSAVGPNREHASTYTELQPRDKSKSVARIHHKHSQYRRRVRA